MKPIVLTCLLVCLLTRISQAAEPVVDNLFKEANAARTSKNYDEAIRVYERFFLEHPETTHHWANVQRSIADCLAKKGDFEAAAKAIHLALDGAPDARSFSDTVTQAALILAAMDKNLDRANKFLKFQQSGPADGLTNPMDAIGYPSLPEREAAFVTLRQKAGDDAAASRFRALTCLYSGKPKDALAQFADGFRRSSVLQDLQNCAPALVTMGLRAVRGHGVGLDSAMKFVMYGPDGPDGKPGTGDEIADPFAAFLDPPPAPGEGGLAGLPPDDLQALRQVRDASAQCAEDPLLVAATRRAGLAALARSNDALDAWGSPGQKDWYVHMDQLLLVGRKLKYITDDAFNLLTMEEQLLAGAATAARARALHFGGSSALFNEIDAFCAAQEIQPTEAIAKARSGIDKVREILSKCDVTIPKATPLTSVPPSF